MTYRSNLFFKLYNHVVQMTKSNLIKHKSASLNNQFYTNILKHHRPRFFNIPKVIYVKDIPNYIIFIYQVFIYFRCLHEGYTCYNFFTLHFYRLQRFIL